MNKQSQQSVPDAFIYRPSDYNIDFYGQGDRFPLTYSRTRCRISQQIVLQKKRNQTLKQPVAVANVVEATTNVMLDRSTSGKMYQFVGPTSCYRI